MMQDLNHRDGHGEKLKANLFMKDAFSDVTFIVCGERIPAHKCFLVSSSAYFQAMFCSGFLEKDRKEIALDDVTSLEAFKAVLRYTYTGCMTLKGLSFELMIEILALAHKFQMATLPKDIAEKILVVVWQDLSKLLILLDYCNLFSLWVTEAVCIANLNKKAMDILNGDSYLSLSSSSLAQLLSSDTFYFHDGEMAIFNGVLRWLKSNPIGNKQIVLSSIRLGQISYDDFFKHVLPTNLFSAQQYYEARKATKNFYRCVPLERSVKVVTEKEPIITRQGSAVTVTFKLNETYQVYRIKRAESSLSRFVGNGTTQEVVAIDRMEVSADGSSWEMVPLIEEFGSKAVRFIKLTVQNVREPKYAILCQPLLCCCK